jgi:hypothetical protein
MAGGAPRARPFRARDAVYLARLTGPLYAAAERGGVRAAGEGLESLDPSCPGYRISRSPERGAGQGTPGHVVFKTASVRAPRGMRGNPRWVSVGTRRRYVRGASEGKVPELDAPSPVSRTLRRRARAVGSVAVLGQYGEEPGAAPPARLFAAAPPLTALLSRASRVPRGDNTPRISA